jgi:hypothetical protein
LSLASVFVLLFFLAFFLVVMPVSIYLFARFFPKRESSIFGFPEDRPAAGAPDQDWPRIKKPGE